MRLTGTWSGFAVLHDATALYIILTVPSLQAWKVDLTLLMCCVQQVRQDLNGHLTRLNGDRDWSFILSQVGMFSFTGLDKVWPLSCLAAS